MSSDIMGTLTDSGTQIRIFRETVKKLKDLGRKGETYDDIIRRLITENGDR